MADDKKQDVPQTGQGKTVAVTGASGFIAGQLCRHLVARGYTVRGTVRSLTDAVKVKHLQQELPGVQLYQADLLTPGSFAECFDAVDYVFHTASPFQIVVEDPQRDLIDPAVDGTTNVVSEALKSPTVKRIVVTASVASVRNALRDENYVFSDRDWNETSRIDVDPYPLSKVLAEKKAWGLVQKHQQEGGKVDLVVICPAFVLGPPLSARTDSTSVKTIKAYLDGSRQQEGAYPIQFGMCDVEDVALAHIAAMEKKEAHGRYIVSSAEVVKHVDLCKILLELFPGYPIPQHEANNKYNRKTRWDATRAQNELGIVFTPLESTLKRMVEAMLSLGIVQPPAQANL